MADNAVLNTGTGGITLALDDIGGVHYQRVKVTFGADGASTDVAGSVGLPTDPLDRAARDCGKVDVAAIDQYVPIDVDSGAGSLNALPVTWRKFAAGGPEFGTSTDPVRVDPTGTTTQPVSGTVSVSGTTTVDSELPAAAALADNAANPTAPAVGAFLMLWDGTTWDRAPGTSAAGQTVTVGSALPAGTNNVGDVDVLTLPALAAGTNNIGDVDVLTLPALPAGTNNIGDVDVLSMPTGGSATQVQGDVAHSGADSGNPVKVGGVARTADPGTLVADGGRVNAYCDVAGKRIVLVGAPGDLTLNGRLALTTTTAADVIGAQGASQKIAVMGVSITNAHATVGTKVEIGDGTTIKVIVYATAAGGGAVLAGSTPLFISTANTAVTGRCVTTGANVDIFAWGYKTK